MSEQAQPENLPQWILDHLALYQSTNGKEGHIWNGVPTALLTTRGRQSGAPRTMPLIYGEDAGSYLLVASKGGAPEHPAWYLNLVAHPEVTIQVGEHRFTGTAETVEGAERDRLWQIMTGVWPDYDAYQSRTARRIPVVRIQPRAQIE